MKDITYRGGRRVQPSVGGRRLCDMIRKHMANHNYSLAALAKVWGMTPSSVSTTLSRHKKRPMPAHYIAAVIDLFQLDEFDSTELYRQAAKEAGYLIDGPILQSQKQEQKSKKSTVNSYSKDLCVHGVREDR